MYAIGKLLATAIAHCVTDKDISKEIANTVEKHTDFFNGIGTTLDQSIPGFSLIATIGKGLTSALAPEIMGGLVEKIEYSKMREYLIKPNPNNLNHDLSKLLKKAALTSLGYIKNLWFEKLKLAEDHEQMELLEDVFENMKTDLKSWLAHETIEDDILKDPSDCLTAITNYIFTTSSVNKESEFAEFFVDILPFCFKLAYKEALKDNDNQKAFNAFQIWILESIDNKTDKIDGKLDILIKNRQDQELLQIDNIHIRRDANNNKFYDAKDPNGESYQKALIQKITNSNLEGNTVPIVGIAGVGKSFLAEEVAYKFAKTKEHFDIIWWIDAENLSKSKEAENNAGNDLKDLASAFKIDINQHGWLRKLLVDELHKTKYLLIFDNACDTNNEPINVSSFKSSFFPKTGGKELIEYQRIIVTSRNTKWQGMELGIWSFEDFKKYFSNTGIDVTDEASLTDIYRELGGLPLATSIAATYIKSTDSTLKNYLNLIKTKEAKIEELLMAETGLKYERNESILKAFLVSYDALGERAKGILNQLALVAPDEIPLRHIQEYYSSGFQNLNSPELSSKVWQKKINGEIKELEINSLMKKVSKEGDYSIHRLLKDSLLIQLESEESLGMWVEELTKALIVATDEFRGLEYDFYRKILSHIEEYSNHITLIKDVNIKKRSVKLLRDAARYSFETGGMSIALRVNDTLLKEIGPEDPLRYEIYLDKCYGLMLKDDKEQSFDLAKQAFAFFSERYTGNDDVKLKWMIKSKQNVGKVHQRFGEFEEGKAYLMACQEMVNSSNNDSIKRELYSGILHDTAAMWWDEGLDLNRAINYFKDALDFKESLGVDTKTDLYSNVSRMIRGVAYGLNSDYELQEADHKSAFEEFSKSSREFRRYAYTAFYWLHFAWDRIGWANRGNEESKEYDIYLDKYDDYEKNLEGDVKFAIIKSIVKLRKAVREDDSDAAHSNFDSLKSFLDRKKTNGCFIDDGTVSVSAVLDYALFLEEKEQYDDARKKAKLAQEMLVFRKSSELILKRTYNRTNELEDLIRRLAV